MQALPLILMAAGTAISATGQARAAESQAAAAGENASMLRIQAAEEEARVRRMNRVELARQRSTLARSGIALEGTPLDQLVRNAAEMEQDAINARRGLLREADIQRRYGRSALSQGRLGVLASALSGASQMYGARAQSNLLRTSPGA